MEDPDLIKPTDLLGWRPSLDTDRRVPATALPPCPICDTPHCTHLKEMPVPAKKNPVDPPARPGTIGPEPLTTADTTGMPDGIVAVPGLVDTVTATRDVYIDRHVGGRTSQVLLLAAGQMMPASQLVKYLEGFEGTGTYETKE